MRFKPKELVGWIEFVAVLYDIDGVRNFFFFGDVNEGYDDVFKIIEVLNRLNYEEFVDV